MNGLHELGIVEAADMLERREISSVELVRAVIDRVRAKDGEISILQNSRLRVRADCGIISSVFTTFGRGAVVAQLTVNQLVAGSNPAARAIQTKQGDPLGQGRR